MLQAENDCERALIHNWIRFKDCNTELDLGLYVFKAEFTDNTLEDEV
jgi:hypothetical protein